MIQAPVQGTGAYLNETPFRCSTLG